MPLIFDGGDHYESLCGLCIGIRDMLKTRACQNAAGPVRFGAFKVSKVPGAEA